MKFPRWRYILLGFVLVVIVLFAVLNFDALLTLHHWAVKAITAIAAILALLKYAQEEFSGIADDFVHTMNRDGKRDSIWKRVW